MTAAEKMARGGVFWSTVSGGAAVLLPFAVFMAFARMMAPGELSLVMLAVALLELIKAFGPQGIYDVLLTYDEGDRRHYRSASAIFLGAGVGLGAVYCLLVALSGWVLKTALPPLMLVLALKLLFDYAVMEPQAVLVRRMAMRRLGSRSLIAGILAGLCAILLGWAITPIAGLAAYYVLQSVITFLMTAVRTDSWAWPLLDRPAIREMAGEGARASGVRLTAAASNYLDQLVLAAVLLPGAVGFYNLGKRLEVVAITLGSSFSQLLFQPTFAKARPEERLGYMARGIAAISLVCGVPVVVLDLYHGLAVPFLFGPQWGEAATVVALLATSGLARALGGVSGALFTVTGRNGRLLTIGAVGAASNIAIILIFARFGIVWAALAISVRNIAQTFAMFALTRDATGHILRLFFYNCFLPLGGAAIAAIVAGQLAIAAVGTAGSLPTFLVLAAAGSGAFAVGLLLLRKRL